MRHSVDGRTSHTFHLVLVNINKPALAFSVFQVKYIPFIYFSAVLPIIVRLQLILDKMNRSGVVY